MSNTAWCCLTLTSRDISLLIVRRTRSRVEPVKTAKLKRNISQLEIKTLKSSIRKVDPANQWQLYRFQDIVLENGGLQTGPFGSQLHASDYVAEGIPVLMPRDLASNTISSENAARVSREKARELERYRLRSGDILLARRGKIGRCALVPPDADGWLCGTGCFRARLGPSVSPSFLIQLLQWNKTVSWLTSNAVGQTMQNLNTRILSDLPLCIPPLAIQARISEALGCVDSTIEATRRVIEQTRIVKQGFLQHVLQKGLASDPSRSLPKGWIEKPIGELCRFFNGQVIKASEWSESGLPIIRIQNLNGSREFKRYAGQPKKNCAIETGELLFAWAGVKGVSFGPRIWDGPPGVLNQHIYRVRPREGVNRVWLYETLRQVTRRIEERAQGFKASLVHVRKADITSYRVSVPPFDEQCSIAERAAFFSSMDAIEQSNLEGLVKMKRALMDDLFHRRIDVSI